MPIRSPSIANGKVVGANELRKPRLQVRVRIGGQEAEVIYASSAPTLVTGLMQINARMASSVPSGNVPVEIQVGNVEISQSGVTVAVQ